MNITVVGHGYVGLVTACVFADLGNIVYCLGRHIEKIDKLRRGDPIIFEPGLAELLQKNIERKRIFFDLSYENTIPKSDIVFIAVGTPSKENGEADLSSVFSVASEIGKNLKDGYTAVSIKSTVPVGTNKKIFDLIKKVKPKPAKFDIVSCPEFLREGSAIQDTFSPDRIIIGANSQYAINRLLKLHEPLDGERVLVGLEAAEIIKYASNSLLATKIAFANLASFLCEKTGANVEEVLNGVGLDRRIGRLFLYPGVGYGGSCFPKDVKALIQTGQTLGIDMQLLQAVEKINLNAQENFLKKIIKNSPGKNIGVWGLAFKPNTDDIRDAPSVYIIEKLLKKGFKIKVYDPEANENAKKVFGRRLDYSSNPYQAADSSSAVIIFTEWNEFKQINLVKVKKLMQKPIIIDGRNLYDIPTLEKLGFKYVSVGRPT